MWSILHSTFTTGCSSLDKLLEGGLPADGVTLVYGEAETGKTSLAVQCAVYCARAGYKTLFMDPDGTFSTQRLTQIAYRDFERISPMIILMRPATFKEQMRTIDHLDEYLTRKFGLVVVDTITSLYRVELGGPNESFALNRKLNRQVALLAQIAKTQNVAVLITSQVRSILLKGRFGTEPVATRVLKFWSDIVLALEPTGQIGVIKVLLTKHSRLKRHRSSFVTIERTGIRDYGR